MTDFDKVIHPGGVGKVTASVNTEHFKGPIVKSITVTTNDPAATQTVLQLKADVKVAIDIQPTDNAFLQGKPGDIKPTELTVSSVDGKPFDILAVTKSDDHFTVSVKVAPPEAAPTTLPPAKTEEVKPADGKPADKKAADKGAGKAKATPAAKPPPAKGSKKGEAAKVEAAKAEPAKAEAAAGTPIAKGSNRYLVLVGLATDTPVGRAYGTITLKTNHPKGDTVDIRVSTNVVGDVAIDPERLVFQAPAPAGATGPTPPATPLVQHVKVHKDQGDALKISGVDSSDPDFTATVKPVKEGREFDIEVKYGGKPGRGMVSAQITVHTNDPRQATIVIPIFGRI